MENSTGVFRCEANLRGTGRENITDNHHPFMKLYFADNPNQELLAVIKRDTEYNTLIKVSDQHLYQVMIMQIFFGRHTYSTA